MRTDKYTKHDKPNDKPNIKASDALDLARDRAQIHGLSPSFHPGPKNYSNNWNMIQNSSFAIANAELQFKAICFE